MEYNNHNIRRQDHLLDEKAATALLAHAEYGVLSMVNINGSAYGIPINYVWNGKQSIYLHCATQGQKLRVIEHNNCVSFAITGKTNVEARMFTSGFESIILQCTAHTGLEYQERKTAMDLFVEKYSPGHKETGMAYIEKLFQRTEIIRLDIHEWSGKKKVVLP